MGGGTGCFSLLSDCDRLLRWGGGTGCLCLSSDFGGVVCLTSLSLTACFRFITSSFGVTPIIDAIDDTVVMLFDERVFQHLFHSDI